ncbi:MAG TPA: hypothetical protein VGE07_21745, partial [Herpetosiphonaceae bacterium]
IRQSFRQGEPNGPAVVVEPTGRSGRRLRFAPDPSLFVFESASASIFPLVGRLRELAALIPGCAIMLRDEAGGRHERIAYPDLAAYFSELLPIEANDPPIIAYAAELADGCLLDLALCFDSDAPPLQRSFVNLERTGGGGTHVDGLWRGLGLALAEHTRAIGAQRGGQPLPELSAALLEREVDYLLAVTVPKPQWAGNWRYELINPELPELIAAALERELAPILNNQFRRWNSPAPRLFYHAEQALSPESDDD